MTSPANPVRVVDTMPALATEKPLSERYPDAKDFNALENDQQREEVYYFAVLAATALNAAGQGPDIHDPRQMSAWLDQWSRDYQNNAEIRGMIHGVYAAHHPQQDQNAALAQSVLAGLRHVVADNDATLLAPPPVAAVLDAQAMAQLHETKAARDTGKNL